MTSYAQDNEPFNQGWSGACLDYWDEASPQHRSAILHTLVHQGDSMYASWDERGAIILDALETMAGKDLALAVRAVSRAPLNLARPRLDVYLAHDDPAVRRAAACAWVNHDERPTTFEALLGDPREEVVLQAFVRHQTHWLDTGGPSRLMTEEERSFLGRISCFEPMTYAELNLLQEAGSYLPAARNAVIHNLESGFENKAEIPYMPYAVNGGLRFLSWGPSDQNVAQGLRWCTGGWTWLGPALLGMAGSQGLVELERMARAEDEGTSQMGHRGLAMGPSPKGEAILRSWLAAPEREQRVNGIQALALRSAWDPAAFGALLSISIQGLRKDPVEGICDDKGPWDFWPALCWSNNGPFWGEGSADLDHLEDHLLPRKCFDTDCHDNPRREAVFFQAALGLAAHGKPWAEECATRLLAECAPDTPWWLDYWARLLSADQEGVRASAALWLAWKGHFKFLEPIRDQLRSREFRDLPRLILGAPPSPAWDSWKQGLLAHPDLLVRLRAIQCFHHALDGSALASQAPWVREALRRPEHLGYAGHVLRLVPIPGLAQDLFSAIPLATDDAKEKLTHALRTSPDLEGRELLLAIPDLPEGSGGCLIAELVKDIGGDWGAQALGRLLDHPRPPRTVGACLGQMGSAASLEVLFSKIGAAKEIRIHVAEGLGRHPAEAAWPALMSLLEDPVPRVRRAAIRGLAHSRHPEVGGLLQQLTRHPDPRMRQAAVWALCRLPGETALTMVRIIRRVHPEPWPEVPRPEVIQRQGKSEAQQAAEYIVRHVHFHVGLP